MNDVNVYRGTPEELPAQWRNRAERKRLCGLLSEAALDEAHANELETALALQPARGDGAVAWPEWMRDREQVEGLLAHLEGIGWRPDSKGDPECHDQGAAMSADVIRHVLLPMLASPSAAVGGRVGGPGVPLDRLEALAAKWEADALQMKDGDEYSRGCAAARETLAIQLLAITKEQRSNGY